MNCCSHYGIVSPHRWRYGVLVRVFLGPIWMWELVIIKEAGTALHMHISRLALSPVTPGEAPGSTMLGFVKSVLCLRV